MLSLLSQKLFEEFKGTLDVENEQVSFVGYKPFSLAKSDPLDRKLKHHAQFVLNERPFFISHYLFWMTDGGQCRPMNREVCFEVLTGSEIKVTFKPALPFSPFNAGLFSTQLIFDAIADVILISESEPFDAPGPRVLYVNKSFETMTGYRMAQIVGETPRILQGEMTSAATKATIRRSLNAWTSFKGEIKNYRADGTLFDVELYISPVADESGWFNYWIAVQRDISARLESEAKAKAISQSFPGAIYEFQMLPNEEMSFTFLSANGLDIFGISRNDFEMDPAIILKMVHEDEKLELHRLIIESAKQCSNFKWTGRVLNQRGQILWISASSRPSRRSDGAVIWNGVMQDVTLEVQLRNQLDERRQADNHQKRLAQLGELAAGVGHEIKNPLSIVNGYVDRLKKLLSVSHLNTHEIESCFHKIGLASRRIENIVNGLRTIARSDELSFSPIEVNSAVGECVELLTEIYHKLDIQLSFAPYHDSMFILGDHGQLQQCLVNLIVNAKDAVMVTPKKVIEVSTVLQGSSVRILVKDSGDGINDEIKDKIFAPFFTTKPVGQGTGIGLSTTRGIIKSMNGTIDFDSNSTGTSFFIDLPLIDRSTGEPAFTNLFKTTPSKPVQTRQCKVLVVDDEPDLRFLLVEHLKDWQCEVFEAENGDVALQILQGNKIDIVFSDIQMPVLDGPGFIQKILQQNGLLGFELYFVSGHPVEVLDSMDEIGSVRHVVTDFIAKPIDWRRVDDVIEAFHSCQLSNSD